VATLQIRKMNEAHSCHGAKQTLERIASRQPDKDIEAATRWSLKPLGWRPRVDA